MYICICIYVYVYILYISTCIYTYIVKDYLQKIKEELKQGGVDDIIEDINTSNAYSTPD